MRTENAVAENKRSAQNRSADTHGDRIQRRGRVDYLRRQRDCERRWNVKIEYTQDQDSPRHTGDRASGSDAQISATEKPRDAQHTEWLSTRCISSKPWLAERNDSLLLGRFRRSLGWNGAEVFFDSAFKLRCDEAEWPRSATVCHSAIASDQVQPVGQRVVLAVGRIFHVVNQRRDR